MKKKTSQQILQRHKKPKENMKNNYNANKFDNPEEMDI